MDLDALPRGSDGALELRSFDHFAKGGRNLPVKKVLQLHSRDCSTLSTQTALDLYIDSDCMCSCYMRLKCDVVD